MQKRQTIGFFGGSFDPIHIGHIHLALCMQEVYGLSRVLFCPAYLSPLKTTSKPSASAEHRKEMVRLAIEPLPHFSLLDFEVQKASASYTIDTLCHVRKSLDDLHQDADICLILGDDAIPFLHQWKEIDQILCLAKPLIGTRGQSTPLGLELLSASSREKVIAAMTRIPILDISSTMVRQRLKHHLFSAHLLPAAVLAYIYQQKLYQ